MSTVGTLTFKPLLVSYISTDYACVPFRVKRIISILLTQLTKRYIENKVRIFALSFVV